jgi:hypothetical protein
MAQENLIQYFLLFSVALSMPVSMTRHYQHYGLKKNFLIICKFKNVAKINGWFKNIFSTIYYFQTLLICQPVDIISEEHYSLTNRKGFCSSYIFIVVTKDQTETN